MCSGLYRRSDLLHKWNLLPANSQISKYQMTYSSLILLHPALKPMLVSSTSRCFTSSNRCHSKGGFHSFVCAQYVFIVLFHFVTYWLGDWTEEPVKSDLKLMYDVYLPNASFKKSNPGFPAFSLCISRYTFVSLFLVVYWEWSRSNACVMHAVILHLVDRKWDCWSRWSKADQWSLLQWFATMSRFTPSTLLSFRACHSLALYLVA